VGLLLYRAYRSLGWVVKRRNVQINWLLFFLKKKKISGINGVKVGYILIDDDVDEIT